MKIIKMKKKKQQPKFIKCYEKLGEKNRNNFLNNHGPAVVKLNHSSGGMCHVLLQQHREMS